ncbi:hypothetical protein Nepgr_028298 [Nepenthes gracilis]|uniref:Uncharacterized protein n=1 Tax=Nepenthes gracilis TaxID=150966 RepID=A0AAD3TBF7_NEPGR|nr:hypothetical protein Nepgr_028298 [Nepenthes gracilis]
MTGMDSDAAFHGIVCRVSAAFYEVASSPAKQQEHPVRTSLPGQNIINGVRRTGPRSGQGINLTRPIKGYQHHHFAITQPRMSLAGTNGFINTTSVTKHHRWGSQDRT